MRAHCALTPNRGGLIDRNKGEGHCTMPKGKEHCPHLFQQVENTWDGLHSERLCKPSHVKPGQVKPVLAYNYGLGGNKDFYNCSIDTKSSLKLNHIEDNMKPVIKV